MRIGLIDIRDCLSTNFKEQDVKDTMEYLNLLVTSFELFRKFIEAMVQSDKIYQKVSKEIEEAIEEAMA